MASLRDPREASGGVQVAVIIYVTFHSVHGSWEGYKHFYTLAIKVNLSAIILQHYYGLTLLTCKHRLRLVSEAILPNTIMRKPTVINW